MYPTFCSFRADMAADDPYFAAVAADFGLGAARPGLAIGARDGQVEVVTAPDGRTAWLPEKAVRLGLPENAALGLMDAVEEAIEDARDAGLATTEALEATLSLCELIVANNETGEV